MTYNFDPELVPYLELLPARPPTVGDGETPSNVDLATARAYATQMMASANAAADISALVIDDRLVPGPPDAPEVPVRVYTPVSIPRKMGGVLYIHGGGFAVGSVEMEHANAVRLANNVGIVVVSVEYRLAPEHPFPAAIEDCYAALQWMHAHASELEVDPARVALVGSSAGGGLAAGLALLARDREGPPICFQYLGIPELDDRLETPSMRQFVDTPMWTRASADLSWRRYLGDAHGGDVSPYAAPARAEDLRGLPPAYISTMQYDPLRDEGIMYALRLLQAGITVELHSFPGTWHGSTALTTAAVTQRQLNEMAVVLRRVLDPTGAQESAPIGP
jgi:acetyl esterase/lipase